MNFNILINSISFVFLISTFPAWGMTSDGQDSSQTATTKVLKKCPADAFILGDEVLKDDNGNLLFRKQRKAHSSKTLAKIDSITLLPRENRLFVRGETGDGGKIAILHKKRCFAIFNPVQNSLFELNFKLPLTLWNNYKFEAQINDFKCVAVDKDSFNILSPQVLEIRTGKTESDSFMHSKGKYTREEVHLEYAKQFGAKPAIKNPAIKLENISVRSFDKYDPKTMYPSFQSDESQNPVFIGAHERDFYWIKGPASMGSDFIVSVGGVRVPPRPILPSEKEPKQEVPKAVLPQPKIPPKKSVVKTTVQKPVALKKEMPKVVPPIVAPKPGEQKPVSSQSASVKTVLTSQPVAVKKGAPKGVATKPSAPKTKAAPATPVPVQKGAVKTVIVNQPVAVKKEAPKVAAPKPSAPKAKASSAAPVQVKTEVVKPGVSKPADVKKETPKRVPPKLAPTQKVKIKTPVQPKKSAKK